MKKRRGEEATAYLVCRQDEVEDPDYLTTYYADGPCNAAKQAAAHDHAHRDGYEWSWPIVYVVKDASTGKRFSVGVAREIVAQFVAGNAAVLR